jgi:hypothetical protein
MSEDYAVIEEHIVNRFLQELPTVAAYVLPHPYTYRKYETSSHHCQTRPLLPTICLEVVHGYEWKLWCNRREISAKLLQLRIASKVTIFSGGKPWLPNQQFQEGGDLALETLMTRLLDVGKSGGIVDHQSNQLIWATAQIKDTAGRGLPDMMLHSRDMSALWEPEEEERREQNLRERGTLSDYLYWAYGWEQQHGIWTPSGSTEQWIRVKRQFRAGSMYMAELDGRWCRVTESVEVIS